MVLKDFTSLRGISGDEGRVRDFLLQKISSLADDLRVDANGSVIAHKNGANAGAKRVLMCAHMDEVGLLVRGVNDNGLLSYLPCGIIDPRALVSKRVFVGDKLVPGVVGAKAIHLQTDDEMNSVLGHDKLYIDIGAKNAKDAESLVSPGDSVTFDGEWAEFGRGLVRARAIDGRAGLYNLARLMENRYPCDVTYAFLTRAEIGNQSAPAAAWAAPTDCALVLDGASANDLGDVPQTERVCALHKGAVLSFMDTATIANRPLNQHLRALAQENRIPWQMKTARAGKGDACGLQYGAKGRAVCALSVPCRNTQSPACVAALDDVEAQYLLARAFLSSGAEY